MHASSHPGDCGPRLVYDEPREAVQIARDAVALRDAAGRHILKTPEKIRHTPGMVELSPGDEIAVAAPVAAADVAAGAVLRLPSARRSPV